MQTRRKSLKAPNKKELTPIALSAGFFVLCTYGAIHNFIYPRSEAEAAVISTNKRIDLLKEAQDKDREEIFQAIRDIQQYIYAHK